MTRGVGGTSPANVQTHLKGAQYPATKEDLISTAKQNGAPKEIMDILERMTEEEFGGPQDVMKAYSEVREEEEGGGAEEGEEGEGQRKAS
jgi:hypothetical protein